MILCIFTKQKPVQEWKSGSNSRQFPASSVALDLSHCAVSFQLEQTFFICISSCSQSRCMGAPKLSKQAVLGFRWGEGGTRRTRRTRRTGREAEKEVDLSSPGNRTTLLSTTSTFCALSHFIDIWHTQQGLGDIFQIFNKEHESKPQLAIHLRRLEDKLRQSLQRLLFNL